MALSEHKGEPQVKPLLIMSPAIKPHGPYSDFHFIQLQENALKIQNPACNKILH